MINSRNITNYYNTIVVGAGPSGLKAAVDLQNNGISYIILERTSEVGSSWRNVWEKFKLAQQVDEIYMPGLDLSQYPHNHHLSKHEIIAALENYATTNHLHINFNIEVKQISKATNHIFHIETANGSFFAKNVVLSVGARQKPKFPECINDKIDLFKDKIIHSAWYQTHHNFPPNANVLVVGSGLSALSISYEMATEVRYKVTIASSTQHYVDDRNKHLPSFPITLTNLEEKGVKNVGKLVGFDESKYAFEFSSNPAVSIHEYSKIIFATGYSNSYELLEKILKLPHFSTKNDVLHKQGVTAEPGLYLVGIPNKSEFTVTISKGSLEAENVVKNIVAQKKSSLTKQGLFAQRPSQTTSPELRAPKARL